jgi:hypothetical protein
VIIHYSPIRYRGGRQNFAAGPYVRTWTGAVADVFVAFTFWCANTGCSAITGGGHIDFLGGE